MQVDQAAPHYYLTKIRDTPPFFPYEINFRELLLMGSDATTTIKIGRSLHFTFNIDVQWLSNQYATVGYENPPMTIVYGKNYTPRNYNISSNVQMGEIVLGEFQTHHSKISIFKYNNNQIRIIILTANLRENQWGNVTQGLWISPPLQLFEIPDRKRGESPTGFKRDFLQYLDAYMFRNYRDANGRDNSANIQNSLKEWKKLIEQADFSYVNVVFIGSVPGGHTGQSLNQWGHLKLNRVLSEHVTLPLEAALQCPVVGQSSSIADLDETDNDWLIPDLVTSMSKHSTRNEIPPFQFIYPSQRNVGGNDNCLIYYQQRHDNQLWLQSYLRQWKADKRGRSNALPHFKCYARLSSDGRHVLWFVLTSANLSKASWGKFNQDNFHPHQNYICNFEAGVAFLPKFIINNGDHVNAFLNQDYLAEYHPAQFMLPYDMPLLEYDKNDRPYFKSYAEKRLGHHERRV